MTAPVISIGDSQAHRLAVIQEFGGLYDESKRWAPKKKRLTELEAEIRTWHPELSPDQTTVVIGVNYELQIGQQAIEKSWISMAAVYKAVGGMKPFLKLCTVTFKALSGVLGNPVAETMQQEARTGSRKLTAVARLSPAVELPQAA